MLVPWRLGDVRIFALRKCDAGRLGICSHQRRRIYRGALQSAARARCSCNPRPARLPRSGYLTKHGPFARAIDTSQTPIGSSCFVLFSRVGEVGSKLHTTGEAHPACVHPPMNPAAGTSGRGQPGWLAGCTYLLHLYVRFDTCAAPLRGWPVSSERCAQKV